MYIYSKDIMSTSTGVSSAPLSTTVGGNTTSSSTSNGMNVVSEQIYEFLLTEMSLYAARSCTAATLRQRTNEKNNNNNRAISSSSSSVNNDNKSDGGGTLTSGTTNTATSTGLTTTTGGGGGGTSNNSNSSVTTYTTTDEESMIIAAEMAAAKLERMGYSVGYRITERLAQNKTWNTQVANNTTSNANSSTKSNTSNCIETLMASTTAAQQLEAVKFLCKEVWMEIFRKQIDKLQTNHRGVFVLKDLELKWLIRYPIGTEVARINAIRLLAFPCGIIRGALYNIGIPSVVSCDFLADGQKMAACSFNIKVK